MISAVILNWRRPRNLTRAILPCIGAQPLVDEIIICHANPHTRFRYSTPHSEVRHLDYSGDINAAYGLSMRYLAAQTARHETIMLLDDDVLPTPDAIDQLYRNHLRHPGVVVGKWGRNVGSDCSYNFDNATGPCLIVLAKLMIFRKRLAYDFFRYAGLVRDLQESARPLWNGEDIFLSLVAYKLQREPNRAYPALKTHDLPCRNDAVSSWDGHLEFRSSLIRVSGVMLGLFGPPEVGPSPNS